MKDYFCTDHLRSDLRTRALKGASVTVAAQALGLGIQTISTIILARLLTPGDFGLVTMVVAFSLLLQNFGVNGFTEAVIQAREVNHNQISILFWICVGFSVALALLFMASAPAIVWFYKEPRLKIIIMATAASIVIAGLSIQHLALLKRNMLFYATSGNDLAATAISCSIPIALAYWGWGYWALVSKWIFSPLVTTVGAWILCRWRPGMPGKGGDVWPMIRYAFNTYGNFAMNYFRRNVDKMLIGRVCGSQLLGVYDRAYHLSNILPNQVLGALNNLAIAAFSRLENPDQYRHGFLAMLSILAFVGMPLSAVLVLNSDDLILLLLGPQWIKSGEIFFAFGLSVGVAVVYLTHGWLHLSLGTPDRWFRWGIIEFIVSVSCLLVGLLYGALGVAIAYSSSLYILVIPGLCYAGRPIDLRVSLIVSAVWKYYVSAVGAGLLSWAILHRVEFTSATFEGLNIIVRMSASFAACILIYLALVIVLCRSLKPILAFSSVLREMVPRNIYSK